MFPNFPAREMSEIQGGGGVLTGVNDTASSENAKERKGSYYTYIVHRSVQSQLQTKNVHDIWHMPNYSLISWVPKTGKNKKIQQLQKS